MRSCLLSCPFPIFWDFLYLGAQIDHESDIPYMVNQSLTTITLHAETLYIIIKLINDKLFNLGYYQGACKNMPTSTIQCHCRGTDILSHRFSTEAVTLKLEIVTLGVDGVWIIILPGSRSVIQTIRY